MYTTGTGHQAEGDSKEAGPCRSWPGAPHALLRRLLLCHRPGELLHSVKHGLLQPICDAAFLCNAHANAQEQSSQSLNAYQDSV